MALGRKGRAVHAHRGQFNHSVTIGNGLTMFSFPRLPSRIHITVANDDRAEDRRRVTLLSNREQPLEQCPYTPQVGHDASSCDRG